MKEENEGLEFAELENGGSVYATSLVDFPRISVFSRAIKIELVL